MKNFKLLNVETTEQNENYYYFTIKFSYTNFWANKTYTKEMDCFAKRITEDINTFSRLSDGKMLWHILSVDVEGSIDAILKSESKHYSNE